MYHGEGVAGGGAADVVVVAAGGVGDGGDDGPTVDTHSWPLCCWAQGHPAGRASFSCLDRESIRAAFLCGNWQTKIEIGDD